MWLSAIKLAVSAGSKIYANKQKAKMAMSDAQLLHAERQARGEEAYQGKLLESDPDMLSALAAAHAPEIHTPKILLDVTTNTLRVPQNNYFLPDD